MMKKFINNMFIIVLVLSFSMLFVSCKVITAQNISYNSGDNGMKGNQMNGGPGNNSATGNNGGTEGNSGPPMGGPQRTSGNINNRGNTINENNKADLMGKVISVDGNSIKIELVEETQNNKASNSNKENQNKENNNTPDNNNNNKPNINPGNSMNTDSSNNSTSNAGNNNKQFQGNAFELRYTGEEKTIKVDEKVSISEVKNVPLQNKTDTSKSSIKVSDLKSGQVIRIWYKKNTETVEKINVVQS